MANNSTRERFSASFSTSNTETVDTRRLLGDLLRGLSPKERDIVKRRFGLDRFKRETLEEVGRAHGLTRERIRQIENSIINQKLRRAHESKKDIVSLKDLVVKLLEEHGGLMEKDYLFTILDKLSRAYSDREKDLHLKKNHFDFLFSRIFSEELEEIKRSSRFKEGYRLRSHELGHLEEVAEELVREIKDMKQILKLEEVLDLISKLSSYHKHKDKFDREHYLDLRALLEEELSDPGELEIAANHKPLYSFLRAINDIEPNRFGHWGSKDWREITPATINDKIYLILKYEGKPMHFTELARRINEAGFDHKKANPATIHNELILDDKYVLIGRGMYGLKEWGLKKGTVAEVIRDILEEEGRPMSREEIVEKVLESRVVKRSTINLALSNRKEFQRTKDNKYVLSRE